MSVASSKKRKTEDPARKPYSQRLREHWEEFNDFRKFQEEVNEEDDEDGLDGCLTESIGDDPNPATMTSTVHWDNDFTEKKYNSETGTKRKKLEAWIKKHKFKATPKHYGWEFDFSGSESNKNKKPKVGFAALLSARKTADEAVSEYMGKHDCETSCVGMSECLLDTINDKYGDEEENFVELYFYTYYFPVEKYHLETGSKRKELQDFADKEGFKIEMFTANHGGPPAIGVRFHF